MHVHDSLRREEWELLVEVGADHLRVDYETVGDVV